MWSELIISSCRLTSPLPILRQYLDPKYRMTLSHVTLVQRADLKLWPFYGSWKITLLGLLKSANTAKMLHVQKMYMAKKTIFHVFRPNFLTFLVNSTKFLLFWSQFLDIYNFWTTSLILKWHKFLDSSDCQL